MRLEIIKCCAIGFDSTILRPLKINGLELALGRLESITSFLLKPSKTLLSFFLIYCAIDYTKPSY